MSERFPPGVPGSEIESILNAAPGGEIASGKFDSPKSSAALAANAFGFFLHRACELPMLPGCKAEVWPNGRAVDVQAKAQHRDEIERFRCGLRNISEPDSCNGSGVSR